MALKLNTQAPDFSLPSTKGQKFRLSELKGSPCIIYFYPKDFTPGCTKEACEFRDQFAIFKELNIPVYGISRDTIATHKLFREKHQLPFELLADVSGEVAKKYDALIPLVGLTQRITYLLDKNHRIAAAYNSLFNFKKHIKIMVAKVQEEKGFVDNDLTI